MTYQWLESFIIALSVSVVLIPVLQSSAERIQLQDLPNARKIHSTPMPRTGGISLFLGSFVAFFLNWPFDEKVLALIVGGGVIFLFGLWDDRCDLNYKWKFFGQILAAGIIVIWGGIRLRYVPFFPASEMTETIAIPITMFALLGIINAINLADGLDGLAGGTVLLSFVTIAALAFATENFVILSLSLALIGSIAGFLRYNTYPATIFMGDAGSQFLGLMLGSLAILLTHTENASLSAVLPLLIVGLPILDTLWVMGQRVSEGRSPFLPDKNHLHHRLLGVGLNHSEAVLTIYLLQSSLVSFAYFARFQSDTLIVAYYLLFSVSLISFLWWFRTGATQRGAIRKRMAVWIRAFRRTSWDEAGVEHAVSSILTYGLGFYFVLTVALTHGLDTRFVLLCAAMAGLLGVLMLLRSSKMPGMLEQALLYVAITALVYVNEIASGSWPIIQQWTNVFFVVLAVFVVLGFRFCNRRRFRLTPLDFLTMFVAFALPIYARGVEMQQAGNFGIAVAKMCMLFYASEIIIANARPSVYRVRMTAFVVLMSLSVRGILH